MERSLKKADLEQFQKFKKELQMWEEYLEHIKNKSVEKDRTDYLAIEIKETEQKVYEMTVDLQHKVNEIIDFIKSVEESDVRQSLFYKYIKGFSYVQIGFKLNTSEDYARHKTNRYLMKNGIS